MRYPQIEDPETRRFRRISAAMSAAVACSFIGGLAVLAATVPADPAVLAVNCAADDLPGAVLDDSGAHAALCAGHVARGTRQTASAEPSSRMPPPAADATVSDTPHPPTF